MRRGEGNRFVDTDINALLQNRPRNRIANGAGLAQNAAV